MPSIAPRISCSSVTWSTYSAFTRSNTLMNWLISRTAPASTWAMLAVAAGMKAIAPTRPSAGSKFLAMEILLWLLPASTSLL